LKFSASNWASRQLPTARRDRSTSAAAGREDPIASIGTHWTGQAAASVVGSKSGSGGGGRGAVGLFIGQIGTGTLASEREGPVALALVCGEGERERERRENVPCWGAHGPGSHRLGSGTPRTAA
jgi:hypothetical protein